MYDFVDFMIAIFITTAQYCNYKVTAQSRTLIMGMLVLAGRKLTAAQLIRLAQPLRLSPTNLKSHLTRMVAEGVLIREGPARLASYRPSPEEMLVVNGIQAFQIIDPCQLAMTSKEATPNAKSLGLAGVHPGTVLGPRQRPRRAHKYSGTQGPEPVKPKRRPQPLSLRAVTG